MTNLTGHELGRYHIIEQLGEGGMATVYKAFDTHLESEVAIKVIRTDQLAPAVLERTIKRFEREAKEVAKLNHPNIVRVTDYGEYEGIPFLVMPYLRGGTLKGKLGSPVPSHEAAGLLAPIARALDYAHQHKMIHRDVKPSNILITDSGEVMLTDFGIVKMLEVDDGNTLTGTGVGLGTPDYMAPEQWVGDSSPASDQYSLGVVLFELVTGHRPYTADTPAAILLKQATEPLPRPRDLVSDLPDEVERVLFKALAKTPADRYQSMRDFAAALSGLERQSPYLQPRTQIASTTPPLRVEKPNGQGLDPHATVDKLETGAAIVQQIPSKIVEPTPVQISQGSEQITKGKPGTRVVGFLLGGLALLTILIIGGVNDWFSVTPTETPIARPTAALTTLPAMVDIQPTQTAISTTAGEVTVWYAYDLGSKEGIAFKKIINQAASSLPSIKINAVLVPFNDIFSRYRAQVAAGGGPDLFIAPNDSLGDDTREGLIADITQLAAGRLTGVNQLGIDGMSVDGKLYGIPESFKAVAFWYNKDLLPNPPSSTEELRILMASGSEVAMSYGCYHHYGFFGAFGGNIFDQDWNFVADKGGGVGSAMAYLDDLYQISKSNGWTLNEVDGITPFIEENAVAIINGNWAMADYRNTLGDKLGVTSLPSGPFGPATPLLGVDGFYFNPNSENQEAALEVALYLTNAQSQTVMMNQGGHVPVRTDIAITDSLMKDLVEAFNKGVTIRPQVPQLASYWMNFCNTDEVFVNGVDPYEWVHNATINVNK
jgi:arabinogalactan oligomer/maltooligosaccharide transport system substrate-binding protein